MAILWQFRRESMVWLSAEVEAEYQEPERVAISGAEGGSLIGDELSP